MPRIVKTEDVLGGDPHLEDRPIGVYHVYEKYVEGDETAEAIATSYDISIAEVHAVLAYAFDNPDEMREIEAHARAVSQRSSSNRIVPDESS